MTNDSSNDSTEANDMPAAPRPLREETMTRWGDDGGAVPPGEPAAEPEVPDLTPDLTNTELVQLRVRVIALENMLVALLKDVTEGQLAKVRAMADHISPRDGQTQHPLTTSAAAHMLALLSRAASWDSSDSR